MAEPTPELLEKLRATYTHCFACGRDNPLGLHLDHFAVTDGGVTAPFRPRPEYGGFHGVLHGGIVATALDEILAWSAMLLEGVLVYTGTLELRYRKVAPVDAEFALSGRVTERRGRRLRLAGEMRADDAVVAEAAGLYLVREEIV